MKAVAAHPVSRVTAGGMAGASRVLPEEVAVALSYNGGTQAVMMASPGDLEDFARGFTLTEGIADPARIESITPVETALGIDLQIWLPEADAARLAERRRNGAGPVGCGLCGIESLDQALRPATPVSGDLTLTADQVRQAVADLPRHQPLHDLARSVHAAGFWRPDAGQGGGLVLAREDVGRHNALDKLAGGLLAQGLAGNSGVVVMTSRVSVDLVQKACRIGAPVLIAVSAPTGAALTLAEAAGLTVIGLARAESFEIFTHPGRIVPAAPRGQSHVA
ncbi:formate dehydrogenase accessory sulfurtransferase FdhD [Frigidibacter sp. ROC022]|uniref:formate dehydrogenase accessory sulfurtransferase FdhD n=1 Tax=Frigidibacter sp. ROC022 TaxID=2971796 RepID=UPI00215B693F|nr:formate dehydrogenase accessory sulfurtransferase FdhD [Frigidibacter sp. ROC022]MCR8725711.1 formate dehydrogenase accessory sulfurtransferase FdhD [Frigidibacter sp. ROC022]